MDGILLWTIIGVYILLNLLSAVLFVADKKKAEKDMWRIRESTLLTSALLGPFGAVAAMHLAHHKTRKPKFKLVYVFLAVHIVITAALAAGVI